MAACGVDIEKQADEDRLNARKGEKSVDKEMKNCQKRGTTKDVVEK